MSLARVLISTGLVLVAVGCIVYLYQRLGGSSFRMPGDVLVERKNFTFYFPVVTSIIVSIVLTLAIYLFQKFFKH